MTWTTAPGAVDYSVINDALPFPSQTQTDYGDDIDDAIRAFVEPLNGSTVTQRAQSTSSASSNSLRRLLSKRNHGVSPESSTNSLNCGPPTQSPSDTTSTTTSLQSLGKRKLSEPSGSLEKSLDNRPFKKNKFVEASSNDPRQPYVIADSDLVRGEPGLPFGVLFELARLISLEKISYLDIIPEHLNTLKGRNTQSAPATERIFSTKATSDPNQDFQDPAFSQEIAAKSPWVELDKEEEALAQDCFAGLGHSELCPGWYGGKVDFRGKLEREDGSYRIKLERPLLSSSCRFARRFGSMSLLRIKITDKILHHPDNGLGDFFRKAFVIWGRVYRAFYAKDGKVFLYRTNELMDGKIILSDETLPSLSLLAFIDYHNPPMTNLKQTMTKWSARMPLGLSNSIPGPLLETQNIHSENDIVSDMNSDMTDGCGIANRSVLLDVSRRVPNLAYPVAVQFRLEGNKGMLLEKSDSASTEPLKVWIRPSQTKIRYRDGHHTALDPTFRIIEILRTSYMRIPAAISPETIINLAENGVPHACFVNLLKTGLDEIVTGLTTWEGPDAMYQLWLNAERAGAVLFARRSRAAAGEARARGYSSRQYEDEEDKSDDEDGLLDEKVQDEQSTAWWPDQTSGCPSSLEETVMVLLDAGFFPQRLPILREKLKKVLTTRVKNWATKYRYDLPLSASAFVVPDHLGVLGPDEIHVKSSQRNLPTSGNVPTDIILGDVLLTRNPCKLPTDVRKVKAVEHTLLRGYTDVIVCSVQGHRRLLDFLAGGDYDGDTATVIWDPQFVQPFKNADEKYSLEPTKVNSCFTSAGNEKVDEFVKRTGHLPVSEQTLEVQTYLLGALRDTSTVGKYSAMHDIAVYRLGYANPITIELAYKFTKELDSPKTGLKIDPKIFKADMRNYYNTSKPAWKIEKVKTKEKHSNYGNLPFPVRPKTGKFTPRPFIMDILYNQGKKEKDIVLAQADKTFGPLDDVSDLHLTQPWNDAWEMTKGDDVISRAKRDDLCKIRDHVHKMSVEHQKYVTKGFTGRPIESRQNILRHLSKNFAAYPTLDDLKTFMDAASISRLRASYAFVYDMESRARTATKWSRFPWDMALRDLCGIKAQALGPFKTVTTGFYERFKVSRR